MKKLSIWQKIVVILALPSILWELNRLKYEARQREELKEIIKEAIKESKK